MSKRAGQPLDLAAIGNGRVSALIDQNAKVVWWCYPRFDSNPAFSSLLSSNEELGFLSSEIEGLDTVDSIYLRNTPIVESVMRDGNGNTVKITDFAPRYELFGRVYYPANIIRRIEPVEGYPRLTIKMRPTHSYGLARIPGALGSNHILYNGGDQNIRVTTDAPLNYIINETPFALNKPVTLLIGIDEPLEGEVDRFGREALDRTRHHWISWVRGLAVPFDWQDEVIRAAITLKLCTFEETGAIVAALTTSIPEAPSTSRNWDYRFCWLRDSYFVVQALNRLGATQTMEAFLDYITTIATDEHSIQPLYGIVPNQDLSEKVAPHLDGFQGMGPVRFGNQAAEQIQHDAYGSIILSVSQMFIDQRLPRLGDARLFYRLEKLGDKAKELYNSADAGIWEYRTRAHIHTHSAAMCWVALDRLSRIAAQIGLDDRSTYWRTIADKVANEILQRAWNGKYIAGALDEHQLDASVLLLPELGLIAPTDPRFVATCDIIGKELCRNGFVMRYIAEDDFGAPETGFLACQFWFIDALSATGKKDQAREMLSEVLAVRNRFGLLSEDFHVQTGQLWGNLPQTYPMAGIVNSCMTLSRPWTTAWTGSPKP